MLEAGAGGGETLLGQQRGNRFEKPLLAGLDRHEAIAAALKEKRLHDFNRRVRGIGQHDLVPHGQWG